MQEEWGDIWASQAAADGYVYFSIACLVVFRIFIAALQHGDEIALLFHRWRFAGFRRALRGPARPIGARLAARARPLALGLVFSAIACAAGAAPAAAAAQAAPGAALLHPKAPSST